MDIYLKPLELNIDKSAELYKSEDCQSLLKIYDDFYPTIGYHVPWIGYFVIKEETIVGCCGFNGQPVDGKVEISYWTFQEFEGQGIASFSCKELVKMVLEYNPELIVTAKTAPEHNASSKILQNNGFTFSEIVQDHEIGDAWLWTLKP